MKRKGLRHFLDVEYLSEEALLGFQSYKYNSVDTSPLSNYVMHPFWNWTVEKFCPLWIAPNLLTLVGFLACVAHFLVLGYFDPDFSSPGQIPSLAWISAAILLFLSHTLDGIDGKQARRTQTSGPLGELFDHGLDSWSTMFITASLYAVFGRDSEHSISVLRMYLALWAVFLNFQFSHFEKYNTGIMYLPWAYDVSMVGGCLLYLLTGILSPGFYASGWMPFQPGPALEVLLYIGSLGLTVPAGLINIYKSYREGTGKKLPLGKALSPLASFLSALLVCIGWAVFHPAALESHPRMFYYVSGVFYSNIASRLIVAQMSNTPVEYWNALLLPTGLAWLLCTVLQGQEAIILYSLAVLLTGAHVHYGVCVIRQLTRHFGILCFKIKSPTLEEEDTQRLLLSQAPMDETPPSVDII